MQILNFYKNYCNLEINFLSKVIVNEDEDAGSMIKQSTFIFIQTYIYLLSIKVIESANVRIYKYIDKVN